MAQSIAKLSLCFFYCFSTLRITIRREKKGYLIMVLVSV